MASNKGTVNIAQVFQQAVEDLMANARRLGIPMSDICAGAGASRTTPSRWLRKPPESVAVLAKLQDELSKRAAEKEAHA